MTNPLEKLSRNNLIIILGCIVAVLFLQTLSYDFTYDDIARVKNSPLITSEVISLESIIKPLFNPTFPNNLYRPIVEFSFRLDFLMGGKDPLIFHLTNVFLHMLNVILCFLIVSPFSKSKTSPFFIALLFGITPINVESVANICGRYELMAALWAMVSCLIFYEASISKKKIKRHLNFFFAAVFFALAALSKESAYTFLLIIPLYSIFREKKDYKNVIRGSFYLFVAATLTLILRFEILKSGFLVARYREVYESTNPLLIENFFSRVYPGIQILGHYIFNTLQPIALAADHSANYELFWKNVYSEQGLFYAAVLLAFTILSLVGRSNKHFFFSLWFFISFSLTSNILIPIGTLMGDRLAYAPSIGLIAFLMLQIETRFKLLYQYAFYIFFFISFITTTKERIPIWQNNETLFKQMVVDEPDSPNAHLYYGGALIKKKDYEAAEFHLRRAHALRGPSEFQAAQRLTKLFYLKGEFARSEYWLREVLKISPTELEAKRMLKEMQKMKARRP